MKNNLSMELIIWLFTVEFESCTPLIPETHKLITYSKLMTKFSWISI